MDEFEPKYSRINFNYERSVGIGVHTNWVLVFGKTIYFVAANDKNKKIHYFQ